MNVEYFMKKWLHNFGTLTLQSATLSFHFTFGLEWVYFARVLKANFPTVVSYLCTLRFVTACHHKNQAKELSCQLKSPPLMLPHVQRLFPGHMFPYKLLCAARYQGICVVCLGYVEILSEETGRIKLTVQTYKKKYPRILVDKWTDHLQQELFQMLTK